MVPSYLEQEVRDLKVAIRRSYAASRDLETWQVDLDDEGVPYRRRSNVDPRTQQDHRVPRLPAG